MSQQNFNMASVMTFLPLPPFFIAKYNRRRKDREGCNSKNVVTYLCTKYMYYYRLNYRQCKST